MGTFSLFKRDFDEVSKIMDYIRPLRGQAGGMTLEDKMYPFFEGISSFSILHRMMETKNQKGGSQSHHKSLVRKALKTLKMFARYTPITDLHRYKLLLAGKARLRRRRDEAIELYYDAAELALKNGFFFEAGLAFELLAEYFIRLKFPVDSYRGLLLRTYECFELWGALALLLDLVKKYPVLINSPNHLHITNNQSEPSQSQEGDDSKTPKETDFSEIAGTTMGKITNTGSFAQDALDFGSLIKASHQISKQTDLDAILKETLQVVLENSGAIRAIVIQSDIQKSYGAMSILHEYDVRRKLGDTLQESSITSEPITGGREESAYATKKTVTMLSDGNLFSLPEKLAAYALRGNKTLVFKDIASTEFASDPYFKVTKMKSVLCFSLRSQIGKSLGLLVYLEHPASGVFTENRIQILEILLKQAALDVEKAQTYEAINKFVPSELLSLIGVKTITDARLGDTVQRDFIGDAIMALCASENGDIKKCSENAVRAAIAMQVALGIYNSTISKYGWDPLIQNIRI
ncbi:hypothetical protein HDU67_003096, partial [Dinochytrium kinnereticum]